MSTAAVLDFVIDQGATWDDVITWVDGINRPYDLTGSSATMQIRTGPGGSLLADITPYITVGGIDGTVSFNVPAASTAAWNFATGRYDLKLTSAGGQVKRVLEGAVRIDPEISE